MQAESHAWSCLIPLTDTARLWSSRSGLDHGHGSSCRLRGGGRYAGIAALAASIQRVHEIDDHLLGFLIDVNKLDTHPGNNKYRSILLRTHTTRPLAFNL